MMRTLRSWTQAPGFVEVVAKSAFAAAVIASLDLALRALS